MNANKTGSGESRLETGISYMVIAGVILGFVLELAGLFVFRHEYGNLEYSQAPEMYVHGSNFFAFVLNVISGKLNHGGAVLLLTLGIIVLITTQYIRVIAWAFYFGWQRNLKYVLITLVVLAVVTLSLALH